MILYYSPGACSLAPHIVAHEAGLVLELDRHDFHSGVTASGKTLRDLNPKGAVPTILLDDGGVLTESAAIMQYLGDLAPASGLLPPIGSVERYRVVEWVSYINSEVHKAFTPLFQPGTSEQARATALEIVLDRLGFIDRHLAGRAFVANDAFSIADAYTFTIVNWTNFVRIDLSPYPNLLAYMALIGARPGVRAALAAEGLPMPAAAA